MSPLGFALSHGPGKKDGRHILMLYEVVHISLSKLICQIITQHSFSTLYGIFCMVADVFYHYPTVVSHGLSPGPPKLWKINRRQAHSVQLNCGHYDEHYSHPSSTWLLSYELSKNWIVLHRTFLTPHPFDMISGGLVVLIVNVIGLANQHSSWGVPCLSRWCLIAESCITLYQTTQNTLEWLRIVLYPIGCR